MGDKDDQSREKEEGQLTASTIADDQEIDFVTLGMLIIGKVGCVFFFFFLSFCISPSYLFSYPSADHTLSLPHKTLKLTNQHHRSVPNLR